MVERLEKRKRKIDGKIQLDKNWTGVYRTSWMLVEKRVPLLCRDKQVARKRLREFVSRLELENEGLPVPSHLWGGADESIATQLTDYRKARLAKGVSETHMMVSVNRIERLIGDLAWGSVKSITAREFEKWCSSMAVNTQTGAPLAKKSIKEYLTSLKAFLNWCRKMGIIEVNPVEFVDPVEIRGNETKVRRAWTGSEMLAFLDSGVPYGIAIFIAAASGLRRSGNRATRLGRCSLGCA